MDRHARRIRNLLISLAALALLSSCGWFQELPVLTVINESSETLVLVSVLHGNELELATLEPGERHDERLGRGECFDSMFVARTIDGKPFAEEPHQMCAEDEWVITDPQS
jgi:hypothetical protein